MRAQLIVNLTSGQGKARDALDKIRSHLRSHGVGFEVAVTQGPGDGTRLALEAAQQRLDSVIVVGGDGTLNEVANGLAGSETALGIIPFGTGNVFAREMGIPFAVEKACRVIGLGPTRAIDLGKAGKRYFLTMAGIGFDAQVVYELRLGTKRLLGRFAYFLYAVRTAIRHRSTRVEMRIWADGNRLDLPAWLAVIGNSSCYGGGLKPVPLARVDDGLLDVSIFEMVGRWGMTRQVAKILAGAPLGCPGVSYSQAKEITVDSSPQVQVQVDGDVCGKTPMDFAVEPKSLLVKAPEQGSIGG